MSLVSCALLICALANPVVLKGDNVYIAGVSVETNTGPMILTTWHAIKPYYQRGKIHFKVLPGEFYASIIEYNDSYDTCWMRPHAAPYDPNRIGSVQKGDIVRQEHASKSTIVGKVGIIHNEVTSSTPGLHWKTIQALHRMEGRTFGPGCSGAPVYKDDLLVGMMVGFDTKNGQTGYFVPMGALLNKNGVYKETKKSVVTTPKLTKSKVVGF